MLYYFLRLLSRLAVWINFRKVYIEHAERIPPGKHVIYALNHPTAFLDPIILGTHISEPAFYMLRGDKFINGPVRWFLANIRNLPIYREGDGGRDAVRGNIATMDFATTQMVEGQPTIILSEGLCRHERRLRPIQRGTARMLFQAYKKDRTRPVAIVPAAINYTASNDFRSSATITIGEPIFANDYAESYRQDPRGTVDVVTDEVHHRLRQHVIHVADPKRDALADKLLPLIQHERPDAGFWPRASKSPYTGAQWQAIEAVNALDDFQAQLLETQLDDYLARLAKHDVSDQGVALPKYASWGRALLLWLAGPIGMLGWLLHYPLATIVHRRTVRMVRNPQFFSSVRYGLGIGVFFVYTLILAVLAGILLGWFAALLTPVLVYVLGYFFLIHRDSFELWKQAARTKSLPKGELEKLQAERQNLLAQVGLLG